MYTTIYNGNVKLKDTEGKYIFWDIDGTLAPFRFNDHVCDPLGTHHAMSVKEIEEGIFLYREPSKHMQRVVRECKAKEQFILGHCHEPKEISDKHLWVDKYYPQIKKRFFIDDEVSKAGVILDYCKEQKIDLSDVIFIDDSHAIIKEAEKKEIKAYHISSFLDWFE